MVYERKLDFGTGFGLKIFLKRYKDEVILIFRSSQPFEVTRSETEHRVAVIMHSVVSSPEDPTWVSVRPQLLITMMVMFSLGGRMSECQMAQSGCHLAQSIS